MMKPSPAILTPAEKLQRQLPKHCFWDEVEQELYIDARRFFAKVGVVQVLGWDNMMLNAQPIPAYPIDFKVMNWPRQGAFVDWLKQIPQWVKESCGLFPSHQLKLLHYAGKYPQVLELLDHAPMLAWQLIKADLAEPEIVALLGGKRTQIAKSVGWPGKADTVKFLTNLRLRWVDQHIAQQVDLCLLDEQRLTALQDLPRINSMALSLAARFPELIGSQLHHALAKLPCRPMQCQSMVALLEDAYALAEYQQRPAMEVKKIGECRYLVEVTQLYQNWMDSHLKAEKLHEFASKYDNLDDKCSLNLTEQPRLLTTEQEWLALSARQQHAWFIDFAVHQADANKNLFAWQDEEGVWGALLEVKLPETPKALPALKQTHHLQKMRGLDNCLAGAKQLSFLHLWQAQQLKQTD